MTSLYMVYLLYQTNEPESRVKKIRDEWSHD
jgi:hypothetical protein